MLDCMRRLNPLSTETTNGRPQLWRPTTVRVPAFLGPFDDSGATLAVFRSHSLHAPIPDRNDSLGMLICAHLPGALYSVACLRYPRGKFRHVRFFHSTEAGKRCSRDDRYLIGSAESSSKFLFFDWTSGTMRLWGVTP